ncbi:MAG TPA: glycosyltransferase [Candidatus Limnocylindrales bacterium]|nr:glycosyltransferase [Candidatus Limnocylindrales bacterium]
MRVALATVGTTGDILPFAILARSLVERGHQVTAVTWPVHRAALALPGVHVESAGPHADPRLIDRVAADAAGRGPMEQVAMLRDFHLADGEAHVRRLREILPGHDIVVLHGIHALAHAAVLDDGLRWATAVFDPVLLPTGSAAPAGMPNLGPANRLAWWMLGRALSRLGRPLDELLARAGSEQRNLALFRARSPLLHIVACSPSLIVVPPDLPQRTVVPGRWFDRSPPAALPDDLETFLADGAAPIVITFGSMRGIPPGGLQGAVQRLLGAGRRVVVQGPFEVGDSSPSLLKVGAVDHRALLPRASLTVHHGGAGTSHAVAAAGVPSVVVPHLGDQRYWADRLHRLGVAARPVEIKSLDAASLAETVLAATADGQMREHARELAARIGAEDGISVTVRLLEEAAASRG